MASYLVDFQTQMKVIKMPFIAIKTAFVKDQRKKRQTNYCLSQRLSLSVRNQLIAARIGKLVEVVKLINFQFIMKAASVGVGVGSKRHRNLKEFTAAMEKMKLKVKMAIQFQQEWFKSQKSAERYKVWKGFILQIIEITLLVLLLNHRYSA